MLASQKTICHNFESDSESHNLVEERKNLNKDLSATNYEPEQDLFSLSPSTKHVLSSKINIVDRCVELVEEAKCQENIFKTELINPVYKYWRLREPLVNEITVTDVMVGLSSVSIRECSTKNGFFHQQE